MSPKQGHRWFAAIWDWLGDSDHELRREIAGGAVGHVLELGAGTGHNFRHYGKEVEQVVAVDPDPFMLKRADARARKAGVPIEVRQAQGECLPFEDSVFDTVVSTWVMCTVGDLKKTLEEVSRVLKLEGRLRFVDHVRSGNSFSAFWQDVATPLWRRFGAGCNPNRDIAQAMLDAGFNLEQLTRYAGAPPIPPVSLIRPHIKGVAGESH